METSDQDDELAAPRNWLADRLQLIGWTTEHANQEQPDEPLAAFLCGEPFDSRGLYESLVKHGLRGKAGALQTHHPAFVPLIKGEDLCGGWTVPPPTPSLPELLKQWIAPPADVIVDFEYSGPLNELRILDKLAATKTRIRQLRVVLILSHEAEVDLAANFFKHCAGVKHESMAIVFSDANAPAGSEHAVAKFVATLMQPPAHLNELRLTLVHGDLAKIPQAGPMLAKLLPQLVVLGLCSSGEDLQWVVDPIISTGHALQTLRLKERTQPRGSIRGERSWSALIEALAGLPALKALVLQAHDLGGLRISDELRIAFRRLGLLQLELWSYEGGLMTCVIEACLLRNSRRGDWMRTTLEVEAVLLARKLFHDRQLPWKDVDTRLGSHIVDVARHDRKSRNAVMRLVSPAVVKALEADRSKVGPLVDACSDEELYEVVCDSVMDFLLRRFEEGYPPTVALAQLRWDFEDHKVPFDALEVLAVLTDAMNAVIGLPGHGAASVAPTHGAPAHASACVLYTRQWLSSLTTWADTRHDTLFAWIRDRVDETLRETSEYLGTLKVAQDKIDQVIDDLRRAIHANVLLPWLERTVSKYLEVPYPLQAGIHQPASPRH